MRNMFRLSPVGIIIYTLCLATTVAPFIGALLAGDMLTAAVSATYAVIIVGLWWWAGALNADTKRIEKRLEKDS